MPILRKLSRKPVRRPKAGRRRGFTIVEVMVAAGVMALAITSSITTMQSAFLALDSARNITLSGQILQGEFEKIRMKDWNTIAVTWGDGTTSVTIDSTFTSNAAIGNRFTLSRTISTVNTDMKQITLTISWRSYDGRSFTRFYTTYYGRNGLYDYFYNTN